MNTCAVILAGGQSSRMGKDKGLLVKDCEFWVEIIKSRLPDGIDCYVSVGCHNVDKYKDSGIENLILDNNAFQNVNGPIKGILSGKNCFNLYDRLLVVTCDMIDLTTETFIQLLSHGKSACFDVDGEVQPLPLVLNRGTLNSISSFELENTSLKWVLENLDIDKLSLTGSREFMNYNSKTDLIPSK